MKRKITSYVKLKPEVKATRDDLGAKLWEEGKPIVRQPKQINYERITN